MIMSIENIDTDKILFCDYIIVWIKNKKRKSGTLNLRLRIRRMIGSLLFTL